MFGVAALLTLLAASTAAAQSWYTAADVATDPAVVEIHPAWRGTMPVLAQDGVEGRIVILHAAVGVTPAQEMQWRGVAEALRENAASVSRLAGNTASMAASHVIAPEDLVALKHCMRDHQTNFARLMVALDRLDGVLSRQQRDRVVLAFANFGAPGDQAAK